MLRLKLRGPEGKYIFKAALEPHVGKAILYRPKQGFAVPLAAWFRGPLRELGARGGPLCGPMLSDCGLFDMATVAPLLDQINRVNATIARLLWCERDRWVPSALSRRPRESGCQEIRRSPADLWFRRSREKREPRGFSHLPWAPAFRGGDDWERAADLITASKAGTQSPPLA